VKNALAYYDKLIAVVKSFMLQVHGHFFNQSLIKLNLFPLQFGPIPQRKSPHIKEIA
jgi:hypothetical protein